MQFNRLEGDGQITAWRIIHPRYTADAFSGRGAEQYGGRFNSVGRRVVYTAGSLSLALLEMLVQVNDRSRLQQYRYRPVTFPASAVVAVALEELPKGWDARPYTQVSQALGDTWLDAGDAMVLRVPSVVIPREANYLINPMHPDAQQLVVGPEESLPFDPRLV